MIEKTVSERFTGMIGTLVLTIISPSYSLQHMAVPRKAVVLLIMHHNFRQCHPDKGKVGMELPIGNCVLILFFRWKFTTYR
jgi:hypothetical protein